MDKETLLVIDCQERYISRTCKNQWKQHFNKVLDEVVKQCKLAMERKDHIIFISMRNGLGYAQEQTLPELIHLTNGYPHRAFLLKDTVDGSEEIVEYLRAKDIPRSTIRVAGVYTSQCIKATIKGMLEKMPRTHFKVVRAACGESVSDSDFNRTAIGMLLNLDNQRIRGIGAHLW